MKWTLIRAAAIACAGAGLSTHATGESGGASAAAPSQADSLHLIPRGQAYGVIGGPGGSPRKRRGWALQDDDQIVVAFATGGSACGTAIYHHDTSARAWRGRWITSLDGGRVAGRIRFTDNAENLLQGRHQVVCERPNAGRVTGTVDIQPAPHGYQLSFRLGRAVFYRAVGILLPGDRLMVGWSFGSPPELAVYQLGLAGEVLASRIAWTPRPDLPGKTKPLPPMTDDLYLAGDLGSRTASGESAPEGPGGPEDTPALGPAAPQVKAWSYAALMQRYGPDGWADRWLQRQLSPDELHLLRLALARPDSAGGAQDRDIGRLIEAERARAAER